MPLPYNLSGNNKDSRRYISRGGEGDLGKFEMTDDLVEFGRRNGMLPEGFTDPSLDINQALTREIAETYIRELERARRVTGERLKTRMTI